MTPQELAKILNVLTRVDAMTLTKTATSIKGAVNNVVVELYKEESINLKLSSVSKICDNVDQVMVHLTKAQELSYNPSGIEDIQNMLQKFFTGASAQVQGSIVYIQGAANLLSFNYKIWMSSTGVVETNSKWDVYNMLVAKGFAENA